MTAAEQLPLPFEHAPEYDPHEFLRTPSNEAALAWLDRAPDWPDGRLALWGEEGTGKTHLLHLWAAGAGARLWTGHQLDWPSALAGSGPIGLDQADAAPEAALLHLINAASERGRPLLLVARSAPARWPVQLPDLASRLRAIAEIELRRPEDEALSPLFARLLAERQIAVAPAVQTLLLRRLPRSPAALSEAASLIDQGLLATQGRMTRKLLTSIMDHFS